MELALAKAVITGGASGLGLATARHIIDAGGQVTLLDVNDEEGAKSADELGERASFVRTDVSDEANVRDSIGEAAAFMDLLLGVEETNTTTS